jgi:hypothetical protein
LKELITARRIKRRIRGERRNMRKEEKAEEDINAQKGLIYIRT